MNSQGIVLSNSNTEMLLKVEKNADVMKIFTLQPQLVTPQSSLH